MAGSFDEMRDSEVHAEGDGDKQRSHPHRTAATSSKVTNVERYRGLKLRRYTKRSSTKYLPGQVSVKSVFFSQEGSAEMK